MSRFHAKQLVVINTISISVTNIGKKLEKELIIKDLERVKCITWNVKLNKSNKEVSTLIDSGSEANLIFQAYVIQLPLKVLNILWDQATINKQ